jgi:hypothetical protein
MQQEKAFQATLLAGLVERAPAPAEVWAHTDDTEEFRS